MILKIAFSAFALWNVRKSIQPLKIECWHDYLSECSAYNLHMAQLMTLQSIISSLASRKSQKGLPFLYCLTQAVLEEAANCCYLANCRVTQCVCSHKVSIFIFNILCIRNAFAMSVVRKVCYCSLYGDDTLTSGMLQWYIQATCATQGNGLYEGLDWLSQELSKR